MNSEEGALYVGMETDNKQFLSAMEEAEKRIKGFSDATVAAGERINRTFESVTSSASQVGKETQVLYQNLTHQSLNPAYPKGFGSTGSVSAGSQESLKREIGLIADLENALKDLREAKRNAFTIEEIERFDKKIQEAEKSLKEYNESGRKQVETNETLTGSLSKWALSLGGAAAILGTLKKAFGETTQGMNAFNIVSAVTSQVLNDIVSGAGLSISRLSAAVSLQKEINALRLEEYSEGFKAAQYNNAYQQLYSESLDATLSRAQKIEVIQKALEMHNKAIDVQVENVRKNLDLTRKAIELQPSKEKLIKQYADLMTQLENLDAQRVSSTKRLQRQMSVLMKEESEELKEFLTSIREGLDDLVMDYNDEVAGKLKDLQNQIALGKLEGKEKELLALQQQYESDVEAYSDNETIKKALTEKYAQDRYEIELKYLRKLQEEYKKFSDTIRGLDPGTGMAILNRAITNQGDKPYTFESAAGVNKLRPFSQKAWDISNKKHKEDIEKENELLAKQEELRRDITQAAADLVYMLTQSAELDESTANFLNSSMSVIEGAISGNWAQAAVSLLSGVMALMPSRTEEFNRKIEEMNRLISQQQRLIELSERSGGGQQAREQYIKTLREDLALYESELDHWEYKLRHSQGGISYGKRRNKVAEYTELVDQARIELQNAEQEFKDFLTGGITEVTVADAIANGLRDGGMQGVDTVAQYMQDELRNAAMNVFKNEILGAPIDELTAMMTAFLSDKVLTEDEKAGIDAKVRETSKMFRETWDNLMGVFDDGSGSVNSLSGAIKGITEQTASVLAGQVTGIRISQAESTSLIRQQLMHLSEIAHNTHYLISIDSKLDALRSDPLRAQGITA